MNRRELLGAMSLAVFADLTRPTPARAGSQEAPARPPVYPEIPTTTPAAVRAPFVGIYRLAVYAPYGDTPIGRLQYDSGGRMWALLHPPGRPPLPQSPSAADYQATYRGLVAYYGTFDVDPSTSRVIHHVQAGSNPAWFGTDFVRWYKFEGNRLILSLSAQFTSTLTWERLPEHA